MEDINSDEEEEDEEDLVTVDEEERPYKPSLPPPSSSVQLTKEQLLLKMESVDREIAATEEQITSLLKKKAELEGTVSSSNRSPLQLSLKEDTPEEEGRGTPKRSLMESLYSENKVR